MRSAGSKMLATTVLVGALALLALGGGTAAAATPKSTASSLRALVSQTNGLPKTAASKAKRRSLARLARRARGAQRRSPCTAVRELARYRRVLRGVRVKSGRRNRKGAQRLTALGPASMLASRFLLAGSKTRRCGGGVKQTRLPETRTTVTRSDINGMSVRVELPDLRFVPRSGGGRAWTQLVLPNTDSPGEPGTPGIPVASQTLAVPDGATLSVKPGATTSYTVDGVDVFPVQPEPVDQNEKRPDFDDPPFKEKPFEIDGAAYRKKGQVPADAADGQVLGQARDITVGGLTVPGAQYDAAARKLEVLTSVVVDVDFEGGAKKFSDELASPWEASARRLASSFINRGIVKSELVYVQRRCGEEMLVITSPSTLAAADQFAVARRAAGWRTTVVQTGAAAGQIGTTAAQIQTFIRERLSNILCIRPSYVTIMGDDELVPTFAGINGIPSDLQYSMRNDADELPDVAVGRILASDQATLATAVTKIVGYETTAPGGDFLTRATLAAQFQDDDNDGQENRTFIRFAETVRNGLAARGVTTDRIYGEHPGNNPQRFNDGTDLPASLKKPAFAWDGDGADVSAAWNDGRFMMIHRDHGWSDGWGTPGFSTTEVNALSNGAELPVVLSINCSSAAYDYDETSFTQEALIKPDGGAVGVFGDTRDSPSWHNTQIALGFVDGMLPSVLGSEGPAAKQRTGDALITGKLRLAGLAPPAGDGSTRNELYLWHWFGDPTMQMWGGGSPPIVFNPAVFKAVYRERITPPPPGDPPPFFVEVVLPPGLNGQSISLLRDGQVIGKAVAANDLAQIPAAFGDGSVKPGDLRVAVEAEGAQPVSAPVDGIPAQAGAEGTPTPTPTPEPTATPAPGAPSTLTQSCPEPPRVAAGDPITVSGRLVKTSDGSPAAAGTPIEVTFQAPAKAGAPGRKVVKTVTTGARGFWTASELPAANGSENGAWTVSSRFAGDADLGASSAGPCTVTVFTD